MKRICQYFLIFLCVTTQSTLPAAAQVPQGGFKVCVNHSTGNMRVRARCLQNEREMSTRIMKDLAQDKTSRSEQPEIIFQHPGVLVEKVLSLGNGYWRIEFRTPDAPGKKRSIEVNSQTTKGSVHGYEYFIRW